MQAQGLVSKSWPKGRSIAASVSVMLEGWTDDAAPGIGPMGNPLRAGVYDTQAKSWAEYGPKTGAWRLLEVLEDTNVKGVFYISGVLAERFPELMSAITAQGHAIAAHAWSQHIIPAYQTEDEERSDLKRCITALEKHCGVRPHGWISPRATPSLATPRLLAAERMSWIADVFDRDLPYRLDTENGSITAIPFSMEVNDFPLCIRYGHSPDAFVAMLQTLVSGWNDVVRGQGCIDITAHAHVFGRPAGALAFKKALQIAKQSPNVWLTHHAELATQ